MREKRILFFCAETYPPQYEFLDKVFNHYLPEYRFKTTWIMPSNDVTSLRACNWNNSFVALIPKLRANSPADLFTIYWRHMKLINAAARICIKYSGPFDLIQVRDDPAMAFLAHRLGKRLCIPWVYQISHFKEEETIMYSKMGIYGSGAKNILKGFGGILLRHWMLGKCSMVFPISDHMKARLGKWTKSKQLMITVPEGVDTSFEPRYIEDEARQKRGSLGLMDKKLVVYVGTLSRFRRLDFLVRSFRHVLERHPDSHLLLVGQGRTRDDTLWLKQVALEEGISEEVSFLGWVPREEVRIYIRMSDIGVSPVPKNRVYLNSSPIKVLEYLAMEIPVVGTDIPDQRAVIEQSGGGICVPWDISQFGNAINHLLDLPRDRLKEMGRQGRRWVKDNRDFSLLTTRVAGAYNYLLGKGNRRR